MNNVSILPNGLGVGVGQVFSTPVFTPSSASFTTAITAPLVVNGARAVVLGLYIVTDPGSGQTINLAVSGRIIPSGVVVTYPIALDFFTSPEMNGAGNKYTFVLSPDGIAVPVKGSNVLEVVKLPLVSPLTVTITPSGAGAWQVAMQALLVK